MSNYPRQAPNLDELEARLLALKIRIKNQISETGKLLAEVKNMEREHQQHRTS